MVDRSPSGDLPILGELRRDLLAAFRAAEAPHRGRFTRRTRRQLLRRSVAFAFVASGVAALGLASGIFDEHLGPSNARAAQVLYAAAVVADRHPVPFPQDDEFYYVRSITTRLEPVSGVSRPLLRRAVRESPKVYVTIAGATWTSATRTGLTEQRLVAVRFSTPAARTRWRRLHRPSLLGLASGPTAIAATNGHYLLGNLELSRERLLHFPTNTHALYRRLYLAGGSPAEVFTEIGDALRERPVPARLRAALYRTLALVPGVRYMGQVTDRAGRQGRAVGLIRDGLRDELIFDVRSSEILGERTVVVDSEKAGLGVPVGTIVANTAYLRRAVTRTPD